MNRVILQPSGGVGKENFENTMKKPVPLSEMIPFLDEEDIIKIKSIYTTGVVPVWGVTPGKKCEL